MSAPNHWKSLTREKKMEVEKHARGLVRGSVIEDAASRFMAMCLAEAIGESKRRAALCDPTQDERVKALDLSAILKHAFLSGVVAARSIPADYPCDGPDLWAEYEPYEPGPYTRILAALRALEPSHNKGTKPNE